MQQYTVLSPWAATRFTEKKPICPRPTSLAGRTIGLYASFKEYHPFFMQELERQLSAVLPETKFSHFTYTVDTQEICNDPDNLPAFSAWLGSVDCVVGGRDWGTIYLGGGDHGGPVCKKAHLPKDYDALCEKYPGKKPDYVDY